MEPCVMQMNHTTQKINSMSGEALLLMAIYNFRKPKIRSAIDQELDRRKTYSPIDRSFELMGLDPQRAQRNAILN